jgi:cytochrome c2
MNSTRFVYAAFVVGAVAVIGTAACGGNGGPEAGTPEGLYVSLGCAKCHGADREGMRSGPPLENLADRWQEATLIEYLREPKVFVESNPRLKYLDEQYPIAMPPYPKTPEEDLRSVIGLIMGG